MFGDIDDVKKYYIYEYHFLDDLNFIRDPKEIVKIWNKLFPFGKVDNVDEFIIAIRERFLVEGWEGDGKIGLLWLPPFIDIGSEDTYGNYIWHVKQKNNGTSWLLSPVKLDFKRIDSQNPMDRNFQNKGYLPVNIISDVVDRTSSNIREIEERLKQQIAIFSISSKESVEASIISDLVIYHQAQLVSLFNDFIDDCYLELLQEVILRGNPYGIKLRKAAVKLQPASYLLPGNPPGDEIPEYMTLVGIVSDMWRDFKYESFKTKLEMLMKAVNYELDTEQRIEILKQVEIRNCFQHHNGYLTPDSLKNLGMHRIEIMTAKSKKPIFLQQWDKITISEPENFRFCDVFTTVIKDFEQHVDTKIPSRAYIKSRENENAAQP